MPRAGLPITKAVEPFASSMVGAALRPASASGGELSTLLRDGRVLSAEVLASPTDQAVFLSIGRHTVPAQSEMRLDPGARFLVRVEQGAEETVLRILAPAADGEAVLLSALRAVVGRSLPLGEALAGLSVALRSAASEVGLAVSLRSTAETLGQLLVDPNGDGRALGARLAALGLDHEFTLASWLGVGGEPEAARLRADLKGRLLGAEQALEAFDRGRGEHGAVREAISRALTGLETEQLLNLARERSGEPLVLSLPFPDGNAWTTARLLVPPREERDGNGADDAEVPFRLSLGLELSSLGPLRVDLALLPGTLSVRLLVTESDVARRMEEAFEPLRNRMGDGVRAVDLRVRVGTRAEASRGFHPLDIRYLRENHMMDVDG